MHQLQRLPQPLRQHLLLSNLTDEDDDDDEYVQDLHVGYRRPNLVKDHDEQEIDESLSDYVVVRLAVARARAMARYRELHA